MSGSHYRSVTPTRDDKKRHKHEKKRHRHSKHELSEVKRDQFAVPRDPVEFLHKRKKHINVKPEPPDSLPSSSGRKRRLVEPVILKEEPKSPRNEGRSRTLTPVNATENNGHNHYESRSSDNPGPNFERSGLLSQRNENSTNKKTNFELSGKLTEDTNTFKGVVIKYNEPEDARKPTEHWRLYAFKGNQTLPILHIHRQSGFLIGRDQKIADIPMIHPSISKQHAVLQYRFVRGLVRLYIIDLESANGTFLNNNKIEPRRYYELLEKDVIKFGFSSREYVVMRADTETDDEDS